MITQVIFTVFTFAFGIRPRELARRPSGSSRAIRLIRASVRGTLDDHQISETAENYAIEMSGKCTHLGRRAGVQVGGAMALPLCQTVATMTA